MGGRLLWYLHDPERETQGQATTERAASVVTVSEFGRNMFTSGTTLTRRCPAQMADVLCAAWTHTEAMNGINRELSNVSQALVDLVARASTGIVALKAAAYRTASGVVLGN